MPETLHRPRFVGGPLDGKEFPERFPEGHPLRGTLPSVVDVSSRRPAGTWHEYRFEAGDYCYAGRKELRSP